MGKPITDTSEMESFGQLIQKSIVKLKTETKDTQMSLPKVPLFYTTLKTITPGQWEAEKSCSSSPAYRSAVSLIRAINLR